MTQPITNQKMLKKLFEHLKNKSNRNYLIFKLQLKTASRISDILKLNFEDIDTKNGKITIKEKKTGKTKNFIELDKKTLEELKQYLKQNNINSGLLFRSRKKGGIISRIQAYRILKKISNILNLANVGTHTIRKTTAFFLYENTKNISLVMKLLNHSSEATTLLYLGITQNKINKNLQVLFNF